MMFNVESRKLSPPGRYLAVVDINLKILIPSFLAEKVHNADSYRNCSLACDHFPATDANRSKNSATKEHGEPVLPFSL